MRLWNWRRSMSAASVLAIFAILPYLVTGESPERTFNTSLASNVIINATLANSTNITVNLNNNTGWTVVRKDGVELGLRLRLCDNGESTNTCPNDVYNSNGDGTYSFGSGNFTGDDCASFYGSLDGVGPAGPKWCLSYSINVDYEDKTDNVLGDYKYNLTLDADPACTVNSTVFDPLHGALTNFTTINTTCLEEYFYFGNSSTPSLGGNASDLCVLSHQDNATAAAAFETQLFNNSLVQQDFNYILVQDPFSPWELGFNPIRDSFSADAGPATYTITLTAFKEPTANAARTALNTERRLQRRRFFYSRGKSSFETSTSTKSSKSTKSSTSTKSSKSTKRSRYSVYSYDNDDDDDDGGHSNSDDDQNDDERNAITVTIHALIDGGRGTDTDYDGICDAEEICPANDGCLCLGTIKVDGCETNVCAQSIFVSQWISDCQLLQEGCLNYVECVTTGVNAAVANGFLAAKDAGSLITCASKATSCATEEDESFTVTPQSSSTIQSSSTTQSSGTTQFSSTTQSSQSTATSKTTKTSKSKSSKSSTRRGGRRRGPR
jgi:hypothetical protein